VHLALNDHHLLLASMNERFQRPFLAGRELGPDELDRVLQVGREELVGQGRGQAEAFAPPGADDERLRLRSAARFGGLDAGGIRAWRLKEGADRHVECLGDGPQDFERRRGQPPLDLANQTRGDAATPRQRHRAQPTLPAQRTNFTAESMQALVARLHAAVICDRLRFDLPLGHPDSLIECVCGD
jgi:hypothetical protein